MYTLYYSPGTASMVVHLALLEIGAPHELRLVDFDTKAQHDPDYLKLNPRGVVPTLVIDGRPLSESAALLMVLAEQETTILEITHHIADIIPAMRRVLMMRDGRIIADGPREELLTAPALSELFDTEVQLTERNGFYHAW